MMDWTDRHCRFFHRQITSYSLLYTEMVTTGALRFGDRQRHLDFDVAEHPLALQLGGSEPQDLAECAKWAEEWGYKEVNLNCGCPSERVQRGAFGACLMAEPALVADCVKAMRDACSLPITVKHRIGLDKAESYDFVRDFVGAVVDAGCERFIVHARNAWLKGLSPKENRSVPPLRYDVVHRLKADFPACQFILNGGLTDLASASAHLSGPNALDGLMFGRAAYENPWCLAQVDSLLFQSPQSADRYAVVEQMKFYSEQQISKGVALRSITRHMLGLFNGLPGARHWRRHLSDPKQLARNDVRIFDEALALLRSPFFDEEQNTSESKRCESSLEPSQLAA